VPVACFFKSNTVKGSKSMKIFTILAALTALTPAVSMASIIVPTYVSGTSVNSDTSLGFHPTNTTTNSGLSVALGTGTSLATAQGASFMATGLADFWETISTGNNYFTFKPPPSLVFSLGADKKLHNLLMWQPFSGNGNQLSSFTLSYSSDGVTFSGESAFSMAATAQPEVPVPAQTFALGGVKARFVQLTLTSNYYGTVSPGGDRVGFGKIRFDGVADVPEASTWAMLIAGFGLVGATLRRRRSVAVA
jgi:hypothetical protein